MIWYDMICDMMWCDVISCDVIWYMIWLYDMIYDVIYGVIYEVMCCGVMWCGVVWCGVMWCDVMWCDAMWRDVMWCALHCMECHGMKWYDTTWHHDDVIKWKHFPRYWPSVRGIHRSPVNSPHNGKWRGALMFSLICAWINGWVNNREAGDLRRHRAHYDVIAIMTWYGQMCSQWKMPGKILCLLVGWYRFVQIHLQYWYNINTTVSANGTWSEELHVVFLLLASASLLCFQ